MGERTTSADAPLRAMESESLCSEHFLKTCDGEGGQSGREGLVSDCAGNGAKIHQLTPSASGAKETRSVERERPSRTFARTSSSGAMSSVASRREGSSRAATAPRSRVCYGILFARARGKLGRGRTSITVSEGRPAGPSPILMFAQAVGETSRGMVRVLGLVVRCVVRQWRA